MDLKNDKKQSFIFSLLVAHRNQFFAKKTVIVYDLMWKEHDFCA